MANENVGDIHCPGCDTDQHLRRNKNGRLYIACNECGNLWFNTPKGQERLNKNGKLYQAMAGTDAAAATATVTDKPAGSRKPKATAKAGAATKAEETTPPAAEPKTDGGWLF